MAILEGLAFAILVVLEDIFVHRLGAMGVSVWVAIGISLLIIIFFHAQLLAIIKFVLGKIGVR